MKPLTVSIHKMGVSPVALNRQTWSKLEGYVVGILLDLSQILVFELERNLHGLPQIGSTSFWARQKLEPGSKQKIP